MILSGANQKLQVLLAGAVATTEAVYYAAYADKNGGSVTFETPVHGVTTGATAVDVVAAPGASKQRKVKILTLWNADSASVVATVRLNDGGTTRILYRATLATGEQLSYVDGVGFVSFAADGSPRGASSAITDAELLALAGLTSAADKLPYFSGSGTAALADFTSAARTLCSAANVAAQQDALDLLVGTDVPAYNTPLVHHSICFQSSAATAAGSRTTGIVSSTAIAARLKTPAGKTFKVIGVTASVESGATAGTYTVKAVIYNHTDSAETTLATFATMAASTVEQVEATGTVSSPLVSIAASKTFSIGWANDGSSPGALSTNARSIIVTGFYS